MSFYSLIYTLCAIEFVDILSFIDEHIKIILMCLITIISVIIQLWRKKKGITEKTDTEKVLDNIVEELKKSMEKDKKENIESEVKSMYDSSMSELVKSVCEQYSEENGYNFPPATQQMINAIVQWVNSHAVSKISGITSSTVDDKAVLTLTFTRPDGSSDTDTIEVPVIRGDKGERGERGPMGPVGPKGDMGEVGPQGPRGEQGIQGPAGPQGPMGPEGQKGEQGPSGNSFQITGQVNSADLLPSPAPAYLGEAYFVGEVEPREVYACVYVDGSLKWENQGTLQGPKGDTGPQGPIGPQGLTGETGPEGPAGADGKNGEPGPAGAQGPQGVGISDIKVEPASSSDEGMTYNVNVELTDGSSILAGDFLAYKGPKGEVGIAGPQGPAGPVGPTGPVGPSRITAYFMSITFLFNDNSKASTEFIFFHPKSGLTARDIVGIMAGRKLPLIGAYFRSPVEKAGEAKSFTERWVIDCYLDGNANPYIEYYEYNVTNSDFGLPAKYASSVCTVLQGEVNKKMGTYKLETTRFLTI